MADWFEMAYEKLEMAAETERRKAGALPDSKGSSILI